MRTTSRLPGEFWRHVSGFVAPLVLTGIVSVSAETRDAGHRLSTSGFQSDRSALGDPKHGDVSVALRPRFERGAALRRSIGITAKLSPAPNGLGWSRYPTTVSFLCSDAPVSCTAPSLIDTDGASQTVNGTADDGVTTANTSGTVNLDQVAPLVSISSPAAVSATTSSSVSISADVSDALSGVLYATCNGEAATVTMGTISCTVSLGKGRNSIVVVAVDNAGNSASKGVIVTRTGTSTALHVSPSRRTIFQGQTIELVASDDFGQVVSGLTWTSDDSFTAAVVTDSGHSSVSGLASGTATITGTNGTLSLEVIITVASGGASNGTSAWDFAPVAGRSWYSVFYPYHVTEDSPAVLAADYDDNTYGVMLRALDHRGSEMWQENVPYVPLFADVYGGVILSTGTGIARVGGPTPWAWEPAGSMVSDWTQSPDGTLFGIERSIDASEDQFVVGLDGSNGALKFRRALPIGEYHSHDIDCFTGFNVDYATGAGFSRPIIGSDGALYIQVASGSSFSSYLPCGTGTRSGAGTNNMWRVTGSGSVSTTSISSMSYSGAGTDSHDIYSLGDVYPNNKGDALATWMFKAANTSTWVQKVTVVGSGTYDIDALPNFIDQNGIGYVSDGETLKAINMDDGSTVWSVADEGAVIEATAEGGVATSAGENVTVYDNAGNVEGTSSTPYIDGRPGCHLQNGICFGLAMVDDVYTLQAIAVPEIHRAATSFFAFGGNEQRVAAPAFRRVTTQKQAAVDALRFYGPLSVAANREYGAFLCHYSAGGWTVPAPAISEYSDTVDPYPCFIPGASNDGLWHTHTPFHEEGLSPADALCAKTGCPPKVSVTDGGAGKNWFVRGPCGVIVRWKYTGAYNDGHNYWDPSYREKELLEIPPGCTPGEEP